MTGHWASPPPAPSARCRGRAWAPGSPPPRSPARSRGTCARRAVRTPPRPCSGSAPGSGTSICNTTIIRTSGMWGLMSSYLSTLYSSRNEGISWAGRKNTYTTPPHGTSPEIGIDKMCRAYCCWWAVQISGMSAPTNVLLINNKNHFLLSSPCRNLDGPL